MNVLFICSQNRLRSPTAEQVFSNWPGLSVESAGLDSSAVQPVNGDLLEWAELIVVMEGTHKSRLRKRFRANLKNQRVIVLGIADNYEYMEQSLVALLRKRLPLFLPAHLQVSD